VVTACSLVGRVAVLSVEGRLDAVSAPYLEAEFERLFEEKRTRVVANLAAADYASSAAVSVLIYWYQQLRREHGDLRLACLQKRVLTTLHYAAYDRVFEIYPSVEKAIASFD